MCLLAHRGARVSFHNNLCKTTLLRQHTVSVVTPLSEAKQRVVLLKYNCPVCLVELRAESAKSMKASKSKHIHQTNTHKNASVSYLLGANLE